MREEGGKVEKKGGPFSRFYSYLPTCGRIITIFFSKYYSVGLRR